MVQNINLKNDYSLQNIGVNSENVQNTIAKSKQVVSDSFENNSATKIVSSSAESGFSEIVSLVPFLYFADKALDNAMSGSVDKNILGKIAKLGDSISDKLNLERFISEDKIDFAKRKISENKYTKYFTDSYKAIPRSSMAKPSSLVSTMKSKLDEQAQKMLSAFTKIKYSQETLEQLKSTGVISSKTLSFIDDMGPLTKRLTPDFLTSVSSVLDELSTVAQKNDLSVINSLKDSISQFSAGAGNVSELGLSEQLSSLFSKFKNGSYNGSSLNLSSNAKNVIGSVSEKTFSISQILDAVDDLLANGIESKGNRDLSIARNKANAAASKIGKSTLGKIFSKGVVKTKDVATYGGGLLSLFFMASSIMNAIKATKEAPEGEKKATFMHVLSEQYLGMILFQPSINLVYKAGGNKYRGMTLEARKALQDLVTKTNADEKLTKEGLKIAKMQRNLLLKGVDKDKVADLAGKTLKEAKTMSKSLKKQGAKLNFVEKTLKSLGTLLSAGLDKMQIPKFITIKGKKIKLPQPTLKGFAGGLGRFLLIMMVVQPLIQKPITKLCHKLFGEPKAYLAKQNAQDNAEKTENNVSTQNVDVQGSSFDVQNAPDTNLLKKYSKDSSIEGAMNSQPTIKDVATQSTPQSQDEIAAFNLFKKEDKAPKRYIPSTEPIVLQDNSAELNAIVDEIIKSTDGVMASAKKFIN